FLRGRILAEACFSSNVPNLAARTVCPQDRTELIGAGAARPCDQRIAGCDHGTHVAGIVAGFDGHSAPSSPRLDGVARQAGIVAVQVFSRYTGADACGAGNATGCISAFTSDILRGLLHVKKLVEVDKMPISAVNMSLGGGRFDKYCDADSPLTEVIN